MPRKAMLPTHSQREDILRDIVEGATYRTISKRYGISNRTISKLVREGLGEKVAAARKAQDIMDGTFLVETAGMAAASLRKMLIACNQYLEDPDDPNAFTVGPRAEEVDIVVEIRDNEGRVVENRRDTLQKLLDEVRGAAAGDITEVKFKHEDPRRLVVQTADAVNRQLSVIAKISEKALGIQADNDERRRVVESELWRDMSRVIVTATTKCPEIREEVQRELDRIRHRYAGD